ncbi:MAG: DUF4038 domain-containing protein [Verrucomicrobia bacterium]|nr:DUF4038 domain-containing protein [Verrucomicrobiota bacterium]
MIRNIVFTWSRLAALCLLLLPVGVPKAAAAEPKAYVCKWGRFEQSFTSGVRYSNPIQDASLRVIFTSPLGETSEADGFWDGGSTWRVRFSPDQPGRWKYRTICSDSANSGLNKQSGEFVCMAATGLTRFEKHGRLRVALDRRHLEHMDGTPFFWLADTIWNGARVSEMKDWQFYAGIRAAHRFTVVQWAAAPGGDVAEDFAYNGFPERIAINPEFFKRLDAKLEVPTQAGMLNAIVPFREMQAEANALVALPDGQMELLVRYMVARWGADPVAWLLAFEGDNSAKKVARWKRIGQAVFSARSHAPVVLFPGETPWVLDEFRDQKWVDVFGYQSVTGATDDPLKRSLSGPFTEEWKKEPARPLISFVPYENGIIPQSKKRFSSDDVRRSVYWSLLQTPPAGISYGGEGVVNWDTSAGKKDAQSKANALEMWRKALFMPAAKQMAHLAKLMNSIDFWKLRPQSKVLASQLGDKASQRFIAAAVTEASDLAIVYVPEDLSLDLVLGGLPSTPTVGWLNPRTGENKPAKPLTGATASQFATPGPGDWVLVMKAGK